MSLFVAQTMRGRKSRVLLLAGILVALTVCMRFGAGASKAPAGTPGALAATTQPTTGQVGGGAKPLGRDDGNSAGGWERFTGQTRRLGDAAGTSPLWQMLGMVVVILLVGGVGLWLVRRVSPKIRAGRGRSITVLETASLGTHRNVHLLRVGQKEFLVASTRERISMLADVTDSEGAFAADGLGVMAPEEGHP